MQAEKKIKILKEELRNEEMKLVLLKKLRQSQQMMKENISLLPVSNNSNNVPNQPGPPSSHAVSISKVSATNASPGHFRSSNVSHHSGSKSTTPPVPPLLKGVSFVWGINILRNPISRTTPLYYVFAQYDLAGKSDNIVQFFNELYNTVREKLATLLRYRISYFLFSTFNSERETIKARVYRALVENNNWLRIRR